MVAIGIAFLLTDLDGFLVCQVKEVGIFLLVLTESCTPKLDQVVLLDVVVTKVRLAYLSQLLKREH
jgi:hypothetical protein